MNKEYEDSFGLNVTETDFRQYDAAIGRFSVMDALSELAPNYTPYRYGFNNPVYWSDPSGANSVRYNWGSGNYDVLDGDGKWVGSFDPSQFGDYQSNPEEFLQNFFSLEASPGDTGGGDGNGGGNGDRKTYEYKGEQYSSKEMLFADLLIETILEELSYTYVYTVISALDAAGLIQKGFQMNGASSSTSYASKYLAPAIDKALKKMNIVNKSQLPTHFRRNSLRGTASTGRFITRWNANIATAILIYQIGDIFNTTNMKYNYIINGPYKYERYKY